MHIHKYFLFLGTFFLLFLAFACNSDPKVEADSIVENEKIASVIAEPTPEPTPSPEEIAAAEAEEAAKIAAEKAALKAAKKKERAEAASKERRRKRRERRKKRAAEKAAAEKLARKEAAKAAQDASNSSSIVQTPVQEDLSGIDQELLDVVQVKSTGGTPRIRFDAETFDFGRIIQGKEIDHEFEFTNTGSAPLVINNVEVTCGCTTPFYPFIPIEPGERGKISVHFSSKGRLGNQNPTITVYTNTDPGTFELHLKGIIDTEREGQ